MKLPAQAGRAVRDADQEERQAPEVHAARQPARKDQLAGRSGANHFTFNGKIGGHNLRPGTYQLIASATVNGGTPRNVTFTIVP